jgi:hypothetical protein
MPITLILSNWFRRRSDRSYGAVRERIAEKPREWVKARDAALAGFELHGESLK